MGKTFRRDQQFRPKKNGRTFNKENQPWKKHKYPRPSIQPPGPHNDWGIEGCDDFEKEG